MVNVGDYIAVRRGAGVVVHVYEDYCLAELDAGFLSEVSFDEILEVVPSKPNTVQ